MAKKKEEKQVKPEADMPDETPESEGTPSIANVPDIDHAALEKEAEEEYALEEDALGAYGLEWEHVLECSTSANNVVTIITHGGKRVLYEKGMKTAPLSEIEKTGINPENEKRKPIVGKAK